MKLYQTLITVKATDNERCAKEARWERRSRSLSLRKMAKLMGISAPYLSDLERCNRGWTKDMVKRFNKALKTTKP